MPENRELKARLSEDLSGQNEDVAQWILAMRAYFILPLHDQGLLETSTGMLLCSGLLKLTMELLLTPSLLTLFNNELPNNWHP